jgi:hypothetical protein
MSLKIGRIAALAGILAAIGATALATTPASAGTLKQSFNNWVVSGSLTPKKLNEPVILPEGSTFNGSAEFVFSGYFENISGALTGTVFVPPFNASLKLLGLVPTTVGVTFTQVGSAEGTIESVPNSSCPEFSRFDSCVHVSVPTRATVGITYTEPLGIKLPTNCETSEPITFSLSANVTLLELIVRGPHFSGTATIPSIRCTGPEALVLAPVLTTLMSGPDNPYELAIAPPKT